MLAHATRFHRARKKLAIRCALASDNEKHVPISQIFLIFWYVWESQERKYHTQKINFTANQKGYDVFETSVGKLSARKFQICLVYFCKIYFWPLNFWNKWKHGPNKNIPDKFRFPLSNTLVQRYQTVLSCVCVCVTGLQRFGILRSLPT